MDQIEIRNRAKESIGVEQVGMNYSVALVNPTDIHELWPVVHKHIEKMLHHSEGELELEDFYTGLIEGGMMLWIAIDEKKIVASMVVQIIPYPRKRVLRIISIGGDRMKDWITYLPKVEDWALTIGCSHIECWGRKGWEKILKDWKSSYTVLTKDLRKSRMH